MKLHYKFSNLLGTVYHKGNLLFTPDSNALITPVGNRATMIDLKNGRSETLSFESEFNIICSTLSSNGALLLVINETGRGYLYNIKCRTLIGIHRFGHDVHTIKFSPDSKSVAVCRGNRCEIYTCPSADRQFNLFTLKFVLRSFHDKTTCINWTNDSRVVAVGSADMTTQIFSVPLLNKLHRFTLAGHGREIVGAFFEQDSLNIMTICKNAKVNYWVADMDLASMEPMPYIFDEDEDDDDDDEMPTSSNGHDDDDEQLDDTVERQRAKLERKQKRLDEHLLKNPTKDDMVVFKRINKFNYKETFEGADRSALLLCADYHQKTHMLVAGFSNGHFYLHEMPDFNIIHSLSIGDQQQMITSTLFSPLGDWIALACQNLGQLVVWEWQSQTYVLKQQGHFNNMTQLTYSPDGMHIASGGDDGKIKLWNTSNGFCFVTFSEHTSTITGLEFASNGQFIVSSSLDGTVRAYDLLRYRNFRTYTSPTPVQFSCVALDIAGEVVCAGGFDTFNIFVWSIKTGKLLDILSGHEGPISGLTFGRNTTQTTLASSSWDKTLRTWNLFDSQGSRETFLLSTDALSCAFRPDGQQIAVSTVDAQILFFHPDTGQQMASIEGKYDLGYARKDTDKVTGKKLTFGRAYRSISYTLDGNYLLAGGRSKYISLYNIHEQILVKRFEITCNKSFDGLNEYLNRRKMTEFGSLALIDMGQDEDENGKNIRLPGVRKGDHSGRHFKPEILVTCVRFSPTGRAWAACTTEGLLIYSIDNTTMFDPIDLNETITPLTIRQTLYDKNDSYMALLMALKLNEKSLITEIIENIDSNKIEHICRSLPLLYVELLLNFISEQIQYSRHFAFYLSWIYNILMNHTNNLKPNSTKILTTLCNLEKNLTLKHDSLGKIVENNIFTIDYLSTISSIPKTDEINEDMDTSSISGRKRKKSEHINNSISEE
ncbi:unnamed protein product [Rotaria sordida]|uniref:Small-subunit processome Utp12 domain-containing protein n=3 Tax=Rotaria sordida TaxID=392033 RepID=A0A814Y8R9_9BILA|nr:unnamed protein product [Rotaria sordida]